MISTLRELVKGGLATFAAASAAPTSANGSLRCFLCTCLRFVISEPLQLWENRRNYTVWVATPEDLELTVKGMGAKRSNKALFS